MQVPVRAAPSVVTTQATLWLGANHSCLLSLRWGMEIHLTWDTEDLFAENTPTLVA